jgi:hypothetical protein
VQVSWTEGPTCNSQGHPPLEIEITPIASSSPIGAPDFSEPRLLSKFRAPLWGFSEILSAVPGAAPLAVAGWAVGPLICLPSRKVGNDPKAALLHPFTQGGFSGKYESNSSSSFF